MLKKCWLHFQKYNKVALACWFLLLLSITFFFFESGQIEKWEKRQKISSSFSVFDLMRNHVEKGEQTPEKKNNNLFRSGKGDNTTWKRKNQHFLFLEFNFSVFGSITFILSLFADFIDFSVFFVFLLFFMQNIYTVAPLVHVSY